MTDEQLQALVEVLSASTFLEELFVAIGSGAFLLLISLLISKFQSKKVREEMEERIAQEAKENLKSQRKFYLDKVEIDYYKKTEESLITLQNHVKDIYQKARTNDPFFDLPQSQKMIEASVYFQDYQNADRIISHTLNLYDFSEKEKTEINQYVGMVHSLINEIMKPNSRNSFTQDTFIEYFSEHYSLISIVSDKRYQLYEQMKK